jgi:hypothetical protein
MGNERLRFGSIPSGALASFPWMELMSVRCAPEVNQPPSARSAKEGAQLDENTHAENPNSPKAFFARFTRVPSGLDPSQVYVLYVEMWAELRLLKVRASERSAPAVLEVALKEAARIRVDSLEAAQRAYDDAIRAADRDADARRVATLRESQRLIGEVSASLVEARRQASELRRIAFLEADRIRREAADAAARGEYGPARQCRVVGSVEPTASRDDGGHRPHAAAPAATDTSNGHGRTAEAPDPEEPFRLPSWLE